MAGVIGGIPRLPASSSKARINRFNAGVGFKSADIVTITGTVAVEIFVSDYADSTDLPNDPVDGKIVLLIPDAADRKICIAHGGYWYAAETELLG
jgi:hypothetical protein